MASVCVNLADHRGGGPSDAINTPHPDSVRPYTYPHCPISPLCGVREYRETSHPSILVAEDYGPARLGPDATYPRARAMPTPQPPPSASPSRYLRQHYAGLEEPRLDRREFRQHWRRITQLDKLLREKAISFREWQVATWYRHTHERAFGGELASSAGRLDIPGRAPYCRGRQEPRGRQLEAAAYLRHVRETLGPTVTALIEDVVVEDLSWVAIGQRRNLDRRKAWRLALEAIHLLASA
jgi:hypothetical protein